MREREMAEEEAILQGQQNITKLLFAFADTMALKCVVELRIADIINSHGLPISLSEIAAGIQSTSSSSSPPNINYLFRIMRLLVRKGVFSSHAPNQNEEKLYGLTNSSKWLLRDADFSMTPIIQAVTHHCSMDSFQKLNKCVEEGGYAFAKANGCEIWEFASMNPEFNRLFNSGMASASKIAVDAILSGYKNGFDGLRSLVDVGGGTGTLIGEIVKAYPHLTGTNFDLPHVVATAPEHAGVVHVGGDMFVEIPHADAIVMKWILHDWNDEDCVKILKNCHKAIANRGVKVIIVEIVLQPDGVAPLDETGLIFDLSMIAHSSGGKERTETEWEKLLRDGGYSRHRIIQIQM
ncbi:hypothetical protein IFM89_018057 [Coptis chinensis]|uniref:Uncharacterized protein n=1 Tax=Coptis chinensis TaxID=261450 RepID=A0A835HUT4_9MAGN|nr:hypothetical protein IFM89_018057 [Coptis chinensis]